MHLLRRKDIKNDTKAEAIDRYVLKIAEDEGENDNEQKQQLLDKIAKESFIGYTLTFDDLPGDFNELDQNFVFKSMFVNVPDMNSQDQIEVCQSIFTSILPKIEYDIVSADFTFYILLTRYGKIK